MIDLFCSARCDLCKQKEPYTDKSIREGTFFFHKVGEYQIVCGARDLRVLAASAALAPIDMLLFCPRCHRQHIDVADEVCDVCGGRPSACKALGHRPENDRPEWAWKNPPHATHACKFCHLNWRPSNANTNGVESLRQLEQKHAERIAACFPTDASAFAVLEQTGIGVIAWTSVGNEHSWVRRSPTGDKALDEVEWCQWCGTHKVDVPNWKDNPPCKGLSAVRAFLPIPDTLPDGETFNFEPGDGSITINRKEKRE